MAARPSVTWWPTCAMLAGLSNHAPNRSAKPAARTRSTTFSRVRKLSWTKVPSARPIWSFRFGMMAVWGMGIPSGCRNRATTANQSARAPIIDASAVTLTQVAHP